MTAQPQSRPMRATSWLANWIDYGLAVILVVCRLFRVPSRRAEPEYQPAYVIGGVADSYRPRWHDQGEPETKQHWIVRPAEIVMLTISFFLAAHLIGGGPSSARAPQLNPISYLSAAEAPGGVAASAIPAPGQLVFEFHPPSSFSIPSSSSAVTAPLEDVIAEEAPAAALQPDPLPAPPERGNDAAAAGVSQPTPTATPSPEPTAVPTQAAAQPTPVPTAIPTAAPAAPVAPAPGPSVLSYSSIFELALQAGWPADRADEVARVAYCESSYRPGAVGYGTYGLMQLVPLWFSASGTDFNLWSDPLTNLKVALFAFETDMSYGNDAWAPWGCKPWRVTLP